MVRGRGESGTEASKERGRPRVRRDLPRFTAGQLRDALELVPWAHPSDQVSKVRPWSELQLLQLTPPILTGLPFQPAHPLSLSAELWSVMVTDYPVHTHPGSGTDGPAAAPSQKLVSFLTAVHSLS